MTVLKTLRFAGGLCMAGCFYGSALPLSRSATPTPRRRPCCGKGARRRNPPALAADVSAFLAGWLAVLGGGAWAVLTVMVMGLDAPESTLTLLLAAPGALVALVGLGMVFFSSLSRRPH